MLDLLESLSSDVKEVVIGHPVGTAAGVGVALLGTGLLVTSIRRKKKRVTSKKTRRKAAPKRRRKSVVPRSKSKRWYGKTKSRTIKRTKNGQPYVILANGRARFIKKSRASAMRKRKGGYR